MTESEQCFAPKTHPWPGRLIGIAFLLLVSLVTVPAQAEICWDYTDLELAKVPLKCVEFGDPTASCTYDETCNNDADPSDCCMAVADPSAVQTIGEMHIIWHTCLGNVAFPNPGPPTGPAPPGRGLRWYAFHRQMEWDFNEFREGVFLPKLESLEWCPNMNMPHGHFGGNWPAWPDPSAHPLQCGVGINRPNNVSCNTCVAFDECLFMTGAGPTGCSAGSGCAAGGISFPTYDSLDDFNNIEEIATLLDAFFHGQMHGAVANADFGGYTTDCTNPNCSTRDGMFWRLHKALDDVVRAWQDQKAVDVTLVIDRSGSMGGASGTGVGTRLQNAVEAADMFGDLLEEGRSDGQTNRIGIVSYSSNAANASMNMPLTDVDLTLRDAGGPFETTLNNLVASGLTSIGSGIEGAIDQLCPGGTCDGYVPGVGENSRKGILLLTDGRENRAPCLEAGCQGGGGAEIDYTTLDMTQLCAVGLGSPAAINGDLLTILAERQGGIFMNNTDATGTDLKDFFTKCFAQLTDEFIGLDPTGTLLASQSATPIIPYTSCDDERITFTSGWQRSSLAGDHLQLLVKSPLGDAWVVAPGWGEASTQPAWAFKRAPLPYLGQDQGTWTMQMLRPQLHFVNGFASDAFADLDQGVTLVRRQIQRLCPVAADGTQSCANVLLFENSVKGESAYLAALTKEKGVTVGSFHEARSAEDFASLMGESWDLIVYAHQGGADKAESFDAALAGKVCDGQRAILTDTRAVHGRSLLTCAGADRDTTTNFSSITPADNFLDSGAIQLTNPGHSVFSYGLLVGTSNSKLLHTAEASTGSSLKSGGWAMVGTTLPGSDLTWHANVLVIGLSKLTPFLPFTVPHTGQPLTAAVRILMPNHRAGGYPGSKMTVEVQSPTVGLGSFPYDTGEQADGPRPSEAPKIPTTSETFTIADDGRNGDQYANNGVFSAKLPMSTAVDGLYTMHFRFDYPADGCAARRELKQTIFVDVAVDQHASQVALGQPSFAKAKGMQIYPTTLRPQDVLGNVIGPGRNAKAECFAPCQCDGKAVVDHGDGSYTLNVEVPDGVDVAACTFDAFGEHFTLSRAQESLR